MLLEPCPTTLKNLELQCGSREVPRSLALLLGHQSTPRRVERRLADERLLWETIPAVPDLQCAWQILVQCANPRGNHTIRTLPPGMAVEYARVHDEGIWNTAIRVLADIPGSEAERERARELASLPLRMGALGLRVHESMLTRGILGLVGCRIANDPVAEPSNCRDR